MKKHLKTFAGLTLSALMAVATVTSAFADDAVTMTGTIAAADLTVNVTLPTSGALTIQPYANDQISTAKGLTFKSGEKEGGTTYKISVSKYHAIATAKGSADADKISLSSNTDANSDDADTKSITLSIEVGAAKTTADVTADAKDATKWAADFENAGISVPVAELLTTEYKSTSADALKEPDSSDANEVELAPATSAPFRITGTVNSNATWTVGDKISVTPVFKITAVRAAAETTTD
jgi:hypothetical protein